MRAVIIGASGGIGAAMCEALVSRADISKVYAVSRSGKTPSGEKLQTLQCDITDEASVAEIAAQIAKEGALDLVIVASGMLADGDNIQPEKSWRDQSMAAFEAVFRVNTFGPALVAKHFLPLLARKQRVVFAALSARVGSISDNRLGGWHAYRASKAALNMLIRNYALELGRRNDQAVCVSLHPGTVATPLSEAFVSGSSRTVFTPEQSSAYLLDVLAGLTPEDTGKAFDWQGEEIPA